MNTLLVRLSSMGDLIHTLPAITDLARHRPDVQLDWLCEAAFADIARLHPFIRRVHEMRWRYWRKHLFQAATRQDIRRLQRSLKAAQYDRVLDSQGLIKSALFANFATAPVHGLDKHSAREPLAALFYQHRYPVAKDQPAVERNRQLFAQAFGYTPQGTPDFGIAIPAEAAGSLKSARPFSGSPFTHPPPQATNGTSAALRQKTAHIRTTQMATSRRRSITHDGSKILQNPIER